MVLKDGNNAPRASLSHVHHPKSSACPSRNPTFLTTPSAALAKPDEGASAVASRPKRKNKRRASRACLGCRNRKVRCDVVESMPCRNCKWDGIACVIQAGRRTKPKTAIGQSSTEHCSGKTSKGTIATCQPEVGPTSASRTVSWAGEQDSLAFTPSTTVEDNDGEDAESLSCDEFMDDLGEGLCHEQRRQPHSLGYLLSSMASVIRKPSNPLEKQSPEALKTRDKIAASLPRFIQRPPLDLESETLEFLQARGAFTLPKQAAQRALLRAYIRGVHYNLPCVDVHSLARAQSSAHKAENPVNLLLYQAVMFAGSLYASQEVLESMGHATRRAAMAGLFRRAKLLYSLEYAKEPISVVQSLLIFSLRSPSSSKQQTPGSWTQLAINMIRQEKLHYETTRANLPTEQAGTWRRLWWCCIVRDTFTALGGCHTPSIRMDDCEMSLPELEDFGITETLINNDIAGVYFPGAEEQTRLVELFIELGKLSLLLGRVLHVQYRSPEFDMAAKDHDLLSLLGAWHRDLPPACRPRSSAVIFWNDKASIVDVQRSVLQMTYHTALLTWHRQCVLPSSSSSDSASSSSSPSGEQSPGTSPVAQSANSILQLAAGLVTCGLDDLMPVPGVALLLPALIVHSLDAAACATNYKTAQDAQQSMQILKRMRERFEFADMAACYLELLRQTAQSPSSSAGAGHAASTTQTFECRRSSTQTADSTSLSPTSTQDSLFSPSVNYSFESSPQTDLCVSDLSDMQPHDLELKGCLPEVDGTSPSSGLAVQGFIAQQLSDTPDFAQWDFVSPKLMETNDDVMEDGGCHVPGMGNSMEFGHGGIFNNMDEDILNILESN